MRKRCERFLKGFIFGTKIWVNVVSVAAATFVGNGVEVIPSTSDNYNYVYLLTKGHATITKD